jgi:hypothetical protein
MVFIVLLIIILPTLSRLVKISRLGSGMKTIQDFLKIFVNFDQKYKEEPFIIKLIGDNPISGSKFIFGGDIKFWRVV